jgi:hypothetical protein
LAVNKSLKTLDIKWCRSATSDSWKSFFLGLKESDAQIQDLVMECNSGIDDSVIPYLTQFLEANHTLKILVLMQREKGVAFFAECARSNIPNNPSWL